MSMRSWIPFFTLGAVFTVFLACSGDETSATPPDSELNDGGAVKRDGSSSGTTKDTGKDSLVTTTSESIEVDGSTRRYILSVPKNYDAGRSYPLLLALHGDDQTADDFVSFSKMEASTGQDAIVAYPDGSVDLFTAYNQNVDQRLIEVIILALKDRVSIDASKIWGFGYSKGAYQLNEIACRKPGLLKAMAIHAGGAPQERDVNDAVDCPKAIGIATFVVHGAHDEPGGGEFGAQYWASRANCNQTRSPSTPAMCEAYDGCDQGKPVVFCVVPNQPHYPLYGSAAADSWAWFEKL
jgi:polyhydroxybutyrate depolymerase